MPLPWKNLARLWVCDKGFTAFILNIWREIAKNTIVSKTVTMAKHTNATGLTCDKWHPGTRCMNAALGGIAKAESVVDHNNTKSILTRSEREKTPQTRKRNREELKIRAKASDQATPRIMWSHAAPAVTAKRWNQLEHLRRTGILLAHCRHWQQKET